MTKQNTNKKLAGGNAMMKLSFAAFCFFSFALGDKLQTKMYKNFKSIFPCVLLTNATHSIGCTSSMNGNVGVLHLITKKEHIDWLINVGPHKPYIPLISSYMFTRSTMDKLAASNKINGALVISAGYLGGIPLAGFSPDPSCPLDDYGMYSDNKNYSSCKKVEWNEQGNSMSMVYYDLPIFALGSEEEVNETINCIEKHNFPAKGNSAPDYPLCAVELKDFMFAAKDTPTCKRKSEMPSSQSFCDPLGDWNVWGTLYPLPKPVPKNQVIVISSKMDSSAFFHDLAPGANNDVSGIVTLLGAAYALGELKRQIDSGKVVGHEMKPIMFVLFNGEIWDYIGSSRMVWEMEKGVFPYDSSKQSGANLVSKMDLSSIGYFIELSQVGQMFNSTVWLHSDPVSVGSDPNTKKEVERMESFFTNAGKTTNIGVKLADRALPLPPASFQRFLKSKKLLKKIPGLVLADHEKEFRNKYYNSRYDNIENIGMRFEVVNSTYLSSRKNESEEFANLASTIATVAYKLATDGKEPPMKLSVSPKQIAELVYCLLISASCPAFREILPVEDKKYTLPKKPYSRYISVAQLTNPITDILYHILGYYTGIAKEYQKNTCPDSRKDDSYRIFSSVTFGIKGPGTNGSAICINSSIHMNMAVSPAFEIKDYHSKEFSTWAESMWNADFGVRMFLVAAPAMEYAVLSAGIVLLLLSFPIVYFVYKRSEVIFTPTVPFENTSNSVREVIR